MVPEKKVYSWGRSQGGRLGHGWNKFNRTWSELVAAGVRAPLTDPSVLACVSVCLSSVCVAVWGVESQPKLVLELEDKHITQVAAGTAHSLALSGTSPPPHD